MIKFEINKANYEQILNHFLSTNPLFQEYINSRFRLEKYIDKILQYSQRYELWCNNTLIGLLAVYINRGCEYPAYITILSIVEGNQGLGYGEGLFRYAISDLKTKKFMSIEAEVANSNYVSASLCKKLGFKVLKSTENDSKRLVKYLDVNLPMVSVCMITYNHEQYIREAIDGVLMQKTTFLIELIISEDCSTDGTRAIVMEYATKYPDIIVADLPDTNRGVVKNSQHNISLARGKYIAICEGDDYWIDPLKLQKQVDFLDLSPNYGLIHTEIDHFYQSRELTIKQYNKTTGNRIFEGDVFKYLMHPKYYFIKTPTVLVRRDLYLDAIQFLDLYKNKIDTFDLSVWIYLSTKTKFKYIDESMAVYRVLPNSMSNFSDSISRYRWHQKVNRVREFYADYYNVSEEMKRIIEVHRLKGNLIDSIAMNDKILAKQTYKELSKINIKLSLKYRVLYMCVLCDMYFIITYLKKFKKIK